MAECVFVSFFRALFGSACLALTVTGCGGGGGAGGAGLIVTMPDQTAPLPVAITPSAFEINNTPALSMVAADRAYDLGLSGSTLSIGVVDSGVDASHSELAGRVIGGGDWHSDGNGDGTSDPYGHGTHVASIIAAASNGTGTQGITPLAEIVSYRILNNTGSFGGISGNLMVPAVLDDIRRRAVPVVNNSWASSYEITDLSAATIESAINLDSSIVQISFSNSRASAVELEAETGFCFSRGQIDIRLMQYADFIDDGKAQSCAYAAVADRQLSLLKAVKKVTSG